MPEAFFRIEIGGAGQGPSWCPDRNLPYKIVDTGLIAELENQDANTIWTYQNALGLILCLIYVNRDYILSFNSLSTQKSGARWEKLWCSQLMAIS